MKLPLGSSGTGRRRASLEKTSPVESKVFSFTIINNRIGAQGFYEVILTSSAITSQAFSVSVFLFAIVKYNINYNNNSTLGRQSKKQYAYLKDCFKKWSKKLECKLSLAEQKY